MGTVFIYGSLYRTVHQEQSLRLAVTESQFFRHHTGSPVDQLLVGKLHIHHPVAFDTPQLDHNGSRYHVQDHLLPCTGFHARTPGYELRPDNHFDGYVGFRSHRRIGIAGYGSGQNPLFACLA